MGRLARAYRRHPIHVAAYGRDGIPQALLGRWLGLTQAQVSRIENGPPVRNLDTLGHWARVLRVPPNTLWFTLREPDLVPAAGSRVHSDSRSPGSPVAAADERVLDLVGMTSPGGTRPNRGGRTGRHCQAGDLSPDPMDAVLADQERWRA